MQSQDVTAPLDYYTVVLKYFLTKARHIQLLVQFALRPTFSFSLLRLYTEPKVAKASYVLTTNEKIIR